MNFNPHMLADVMPDNETKSVWVNRFDEQSVISFYDRFFKLEADPSVDIIPVFINSPGGELHALVAMRDLIKSSPKPVATVAIGTADSCGVFLLASGSKGYRFASPDTTMMIHQAGGVVGGKTADIIEAAATLKMQNNKIMENFAKDLRKSLAWVENQIFKKNNTDWTLTATQAKHIGLIDHIAIPRIVTSPAMSSLGNHTSYEAAITKAKPKERKR